MKMQLTTEEQGLAGRILQQIGEQVIGADPLISVGNELFTVAPDQTEQSEPLTLDRLAEAARLMMTPIVTDIWFVDHPCHYWEFARRCLAKHAAFAPCAGGLWAVDGVRLHDYWSSEFSPEAPAWCKHPGVWVEYNNGDCWRLEDVAKMGPRGWFARQQWEHDDWRRRATGFIRAMSNRLDQNRIAWSFGVNHPICNKLKRIVDLALELLATRTNFGPRPAGESSIRDMMAALRTRAVIESLARGVATLESGWEV